MIHLENLTVVNLFQKKNSALYKTRNLVSEIAISSSRYLSWVNWIQFIPLLSPHFKFNPKVKANLTSIFGQRFATRCTLELSRRAQRSSENSAATFVRKKSVGAEMSRCYIRSGSSVVHSKLCKLSGIELRRSAIPCRSLFAVPGSFLFGVTNPPTPRRGPGTPHSRF